MYFRFLIVGDLSSSLKCLSNYNVLLQAKHFFFFFFSSPSLKHVTNTRCLTRLYKFKVIGVTKTLISHYFKLENSRGTLQATCLQDLTQHI